MASTRLWPMCDARDSRDWKGHRGLDSAALSNTFQQDGPLLESPIESTLRIKYRYKIIYIYIRGLSKSDSAPDEVRPTNLLVFGFSSQRRDVVHGVRVRPLNPWHKALQGGAPLQSIFYNPTCAVCEDKYRPCKMFQIIHRGFQKQGFICGDQWQNNSSGFLLILTRGRLYLHRDSTANPNPKSCKFHLIGRDL